MNLIKKMLAPSIMTTISISCFCLSSPAMASYTTESISVTNQSTQAVSVQITPLAFVVEPTQKITRFLKMISVQKEHFWSSSPPIAMEGSTAIITSSNNTPITSSNNTPICTVKTHFSILHQLQIESDNPEKCYSIVEYSEFGSEIQINIVVS